MAEAVLCEIRRNLQGGTGTSRGGQTLSLAGERRRIVRGKKRFCCLVFRISKTLRVRLMGIKAMAICFNNRVHCIGKQPNRVCGGTTTQQGAQRSHNSIAL